MPAPRKTPGFPPVRVPGRTPFTTAREREETLSLVRRLAASAGAAVADLPLAAATLEALGGGRSTARVFKLTPFFGLGGRTKGPSVVVKIAARAQGMKEKANYDKFVRALPSACRPELLAFAMTRARAGLCYAFAGSPDGTRTDTLTDHLRRGNAGSVELVLRKIFKPLRRTWYGPAAIRMEKDIARRYSDHYFNGQRSSARAEAALQDCAARYFQLRQEDGRYVKGRLSFPSPRATLFAAGRKRPYRSGILHGDLNSDNIVITDADANGGAAGAKLIDFQKTGRGHVLEDLIALEASVRINFPRDASFGEVLEKERLIALGRRPRNDPYAAAIRRVRDAALRYFGRAETQANYHFALAAIGLRLMHATDLTHAARARITASALWAAKALAGEP